MRRAAAILFCLLPWAIVGCGDRSPPALWPEPPPPALAEPIGVADPSATPPSEPAPKSVGDPKVEQPPPKPVEAKQDE